MTVCTFLHRQLGLDRAVVFSLVLKFWQSGAGLLGLFLIGIYFPPEVQGFYYTFTSLVALQSFVELGLYLVITNLASHEWAKLRLNRDGEIEGDTHALSRLVSLGRFVFKWYAVAAIGFFLLAGVGGYWFLSNAKAPGIDWQIPWLLHIVFSSVLLWCMPFLSLLEGCDQVAVVAKFRVWQSLASSLGFWVAIVSGANLWAAPALSMLAAGFCVYYLIVSRRDFFRPFFKLPATTGMDWKLEILPMQWRLALQGVVNYFVFSLLTPVMFQYHGPVVAGQMGMSLQLVNAVQSVASIWMLTKTPRFGVLVAQRQFAKLDDEWRKATLLSVGMMLLGESILLGILFVGTEMRWDLVGRVLSPVPFVLLAFGAVFSLATQSFSLYLRAHKKEVLTPVGVVSGVLMGALVWLLGKNFGAPGASASYLLVMAGVAFPLAFLIWKRARRNWH
jgi:hypothetical protein